MSNSIKFDSIWYGFHLATMINGQYHSIENAAIGVEKQRITWIGKEADLPFIKPKLSIVSMAVG